MHPNPAFRRVPADRSLAFAVARGFGVLSVNGSDGPLAAHVPFLPGGDGASIDLHLALSNAIVRAALPAPAVMVVSGPDAYVSPDWYGVPDQVPTWNYVAVHLRGTLALCPDDELRAQADGLSARFEAGLAPKRPWTSAKMTPGVMERMMRAIVPLRLSISAIDGTWKLSQNKGPAVRLAAADGLDATGDAQAQALARLMRDLPE
jgi:transcriptional regulator